MNIEAVLDVARARLSTISSAAPFLEAARLLGTGAFRMLVVCREDGFVCGVVTRTDAMRHVGRGDGLFLASVADVMSASVVAAFASDDLVTTWRMMLEKGLNHVPVIDRGGRPLGVLNGDDPLKVLLKSEEYEEHLLVDYVAGFGYR